jgi:hypothetical protein
VVRRVRDRFVTYFLVGEYLVAMRPISIITIPEPQTLGSVIVILLTNIAVPIGLGLLPATSYRKSVEVPHLLSDA